MIVVGGAKGIGAAAARLFGIEGASVAVIDRLAGAGDGGAPVFRADITEPDEVAAQFLLAIEHLGGLDVLYVSAGVESTHSSVDTDLAEWSRVMAVNATGTFLCAQHAMRHLREARKGGSIVLTSSTRATITGPDSCAYTTSKGAVSALGRSLAIEGAPHGIRVNSVLPGAIMTSMLQREASTSAAPDDFQLARWAAMHPLGRLGTAEDVAEAVLFLASDAASFITGTAIPVDGGMMAVEPGGPPITYGDPIED